MLGWIVPFYIYSFQQHPLLCCLGIPNRLPTSLSSLHCIFLSLQSLFPPPPGACAAHNPGISYLLSCPVSPGQPPTALRPSSQSLALLCSACCHYGNLCEDDLRGEDDLRDEDALRDEGALRDVVTAAAFCSGTGNSIRTEAAWEGEMGVMIFLLMAIELLLKHGWKCF